MKICPKCGSENYHVPEFCSKCGEPFTTDKMETNKSEMVSAAMNSVEDNQTLCSQYDLIPNLQQENLQQPAQQETIKPKKKYIKLLISVLFITALTTIIIILDDVVPRNVDITFSDGSSYVGKVSDGNFNGKGTYTFTNFDKYVGEWKDNKKNGQGTYTYSNGDKYVGEFRDGDFNGQGTFTFKNGDKYVGEWKDDNINGQGKYTFASGNQYIGGFIDGKKNGKGTFTFADGTTETGEWKDDEFIG